MARNTNDPQTIHLKNVRLSFLQLFEPKAPVAGGKEKFGLNVIIDPNTSQGQENLKIIKAAIKASELDKFGKSPMTYKSVDRQCLISGDEDCFINSKTGERYPGYEGMMILRLGSDKEHPPQVVDRNPSIVLDKDDPIPYAGCYGDIFGRIFSVDGKDKGGAGTFAGVNIVQFRKHGEPFGGANVDPTRVMDTIEDDDDDEAPRTTSKKASKAAVEEDEDEVEDLL